MSTIVMVSVMVVVSCAFGVFVLFNAEDKPKRKSTQNPHKHA